MPTERKPESQTVRFIRRELLDPPRHPMRCELDDEKFTELVESIRAVGIKVPLLVEAEGDRVRVHAGHRRLLAAERAGVRFLPCIVYPAGSVDADLIKIHENLGREDIPAADEAIFYAELLETRAGGDVDKLCELVSQRRLYVEERLLLLAGDKDVFAALQERKLSFAVARELNKCKDEKLRKVYLQAAVRGGASARQVGEWRTKSEAYEKSFAESDEHVAKVSDRPRTVVETGLVCFLCENKNEPWDLELLYVHRGCRRMVLDRWLAALHPTETQKQ